jgi:hypothetical protein
MKKRPLMMLITILSLSYSMLYAAPTIGTLIELPSVDAASGSSAFFNTHPLASSLINAVYLDIGSLNNAGTQNATGACVKFPGHYKFTYSAPKHPVYNKQGVITSEIPCMSITQLANAYAGKKLYIWISSYGNTRINSVSYANIIANAVNSTPQIAGVAFEDSAVFTKSLDRYTFYSTLAKAMPTKQILIYETQWASLATSPSDPTSKLAKYSNITAAIPLYDVVGSTLDFKNPNTNSTQFSPQPLSTYTTGIKSHVRSALIGPGIAGLKFQYVLPASGTDSIWTKLQTFNIPAPDLSAEQSTDQYKKLGNTITNSDIVCQFALSALDQINSITRKNALFTGVTLYSVKPTIDGNGFWQSAANQAKCSSTHNSIKCYGTYPATIETSVLSVVQHFLNNTPMKCIAPPA